MKSFKGILSMIVLGFFPLLFGCATVNKGRGERVRLKKPRFTPLTDSEWNEEQRKILTPMKNDGRAFNVYRTFARNPKMMEIFLPFSAYILRGSSLPPRDRQILILRIGWLCRSEYEFGRQALNAKAVGLNPEEIYRITEGASAPGWDPFEATLLRAVDELHSDAFISDATWNGLAKRYDEKQLIDVVMTVGQYNMVSMFLNTMGVQLEEGVAGFPQGKNK